MKRIAFVIATLSSGGAERAVSNITTHLPEEYEADIILNDTANITYPYKGNIINLGLKPKVNKVNLWYQAKVLVRRVTLLRKLKKRNHYLGVLSFSDSANVANILSGNKHCKTILSIQNNLTKAKDNWAYRLIVNPLAKLIYNKADKVAAASEGVRKDLIDNFKLSPTNIITIYNGINCSFIQKRILEEVSPSEKCWPDTIYTLATMGRLVDQKGQWHLIRALTILKQNGLDFKLLILGEGPLKDYLVSLSQEIGLADNVFFCGFCDNPFKILKEADIYVFPSMYEGFSNALPEAMCNGIPCICTDCDSGPRELLAPDTDITYKNKDRIEYAQYGVLVPVCDGRHYKAYDKLTKEESLMGQAIYNLLKDKQKQDEYRERQKQRVQQFDMDHIVRQWISAIET